MASTHASPCFDPCWLQAEAQSRAASEAESRAAKLEVRHGFTGWLPLLFLLKIVLSESCCHRQFLGWPGLAATGRIKYSSTHSAPNILQTPQVELQAQRSSLAAAQSDDGALRKDFDRLLAAAVAAKEEAMEQRLQDAERAVQEAMAQAR